MGTKKYKNKYRIESNRMPAWDYSANGRYFITLVTQNRECNLGEIKMINKIPTMILSEIGKIIKTEFLKSFEIRKELFLDEYIIMPNHLHAIVILKRNIIGLIGLDIVEPHGRAAQQFQSRAQNQSQPQKQSQSQKQNQPPKLIRKPKSISSFIGGYKSAINTKVDNYIDDNNLDIPKYNKNNHFFQPNYHDRIIRNDAEYNRIKNYIKNNPKNWIDDKLRK